MIQRDQDLSNTYLHSTDFVQLAGWLCIVGALLQIVSGVTVSIVPGLSKTSGDFFRYGVVLFVLIGVLMLGAVLGLIGSRAAGSGRLVALGLGLAVLGRVLFITGEIVVRISLSAGSAVLGIAEPMTGLGMILVGVAVVRSGRWQGAFRFAPLACGLYIFVVLVPAFAVSHGPNFLAVAGWGVCWLFVGLALTQSLPVGSRVSDPPGHGMVRMGSGSGG